MRFFFKLIKLIGMVVSLLVVGKGFIEDNLISNVGVAVILAYRNSHGRDF